MASFRREKRKLKRQIQKSLMLIAFISAPLIYAYQHFFASSDSNQLTERRLLASDDDGYYIDSLNEFPPLVFTYEQIKEWAWILYFFGMFYTFIGIAIICDDYFVPAIEVIVDRLDMEEDTAGATWLAIGTSAPELFTAFVGTFVAQSDVGFGTIIGSAVFNVLLIIGACAIYTSGDLKLQWWSFLRDCLFFLLSLGFLALFAGGITPYEMYWWECLFLLALYVCYVLLMKWNSNLKNWFYNQFIWTEDEKQLLIKKNENGTTKRRSVDVELSTTIQSGTMPTVSGGRKRTGSGRKRTFEAISNADADRFDEDHDDDDNESELDLSWPNNTKDRIWYIIKAPLQFSIHYTCGDMSQPKNQWYWPWTFFACLMWLGGISYLMVWWAVCVGYAWNVPQVLMGLVFLAAGTSVPELFSCVIVAKKGQADMAVSGSIGSNIFDVLVGLPLPWLAFALTQAPDFYGDIKIDVKAQGLFLSILVLIIMLALCVILVMINKWILTHCMGWTMVALYLVFVGQDLARHYWFDIEF